ncbi:alpha/beta hydrolase [Azoarcus indigens]|uniref:alpha/beta hydrolase n=1 Tax=Azoarcus indigens TaxID=29545 RepID=UPI001FEAE0C0|nr:alpha/beta hydrolase [Azoarcus indigens]
MPVRAAAVVRSVSAAQSAAGISTAALLVCLATGLTACSTVPTPEARRDAADALARAQGWQAQAIPAGAFTLLAYLPANAAADPADTLTVYLEGDGLAWITRSQPSDDPTPRDPLALRLALAQPAGKAAYLGRPCQYLRQQNPACGSRYWTTARFAPEVVEASSRALDQLKQATASRRLILVGHSGGGAVAALLAARRTDVDRLITIAGNLDHRAWTTRLRLSPLTASLNPADEIAALRRLPQWHFAGGKDSALPAELVRNFAAAFPPGSPVQVRVEPDYDHHCCWAQAWPQLYGMAAGQ